MQGITNLVEVFDASFHFREERLVEFEVFLRHVVERVVTVQYDEEHEGTILEHGACVRNDPHQREDDDLHDEADALHHHNEDGIEREDTHDCDGHLLDNDAQPKTPRPGERADVASVSRRAAPEQRLGVEQAQSAIHLRPDPVAARVFVVVFAALTAAHARRCGGIRGVEEHAEAHVDGGKTVEDVDDHGERDDDRPVDYRHDAAK